MIFASSTVSDKTQPAGVTPRKGRSQMIGHDQGATIVPEGTSKEPVSSVELVLSIVVLAAAAIFPNAYVLAGIGAINLASIALTVLVPTVVVVFGVLLYARVSGIGVLGRGIAVALLAGILATASLDVIRVPSTFAGYLPGDEAKEIAMKLFATPGVETMPMHDAGGMSMHDTMGSMKLRPFQVALGYLYHYWNGISFALVFVTLFGRVRWWGAVLYSVFFVDAGMMIAMPFMMKMSLPAPAWIAAFLAHVAYGTTLGLVTWRLLSSPGLLDRVAAMLRA